MFEKCSIANCNKQAVYDPNEIGSKYGVDLYLCQNCFDKYRNKLGQNRTVNPIQNQGKTGYVGGLNIANVVANALVGLVTPNKENHLATILYLKTGKNISKELNQIISSADKVDIDLMPRELTTETIKHPWWVKFFNIVGVTTTQGKASLLNLVKNSVAGISEAKLSDYIDKGTKFVRDAAETYRKMTSTDASSPAGKHKNRSVAKQAIFAVSNMYDDIISKAIVPLGMDLRTVLEMFSKYIVPTMQSNGGNFSTNDANNISGGDPKLYRLIINAYKSYQAIFSALKKNPL